MRFENHNQEKYLPKSNILSDELKRLSVENYNNLDVFTNLENTLKQHGYNLASNNEAVSIFNDNSLFCRTENFSRLMDLITEKRPIDLQNEENNANLCIMSGSTGYKVAMEEGFSGKDVNHAVKAVVTFTGNNLSRCDQISKNDELWDLKPKTASVSFSAKGQIFEDDVEMISFRFPVQLYPESMFTDTELEMLEENQIKFIVRHYTPIHNNKITTH